jgi:ABC-type lipoprotein export system ATPase subunit
MTPLRIEGLRKGYVGPDGARHVVIDLPAFSLDAGEQVALHGRSGSGKTTLLHCIAGILRPDAGRVVVAGEDVTAASESGRDRIRGRHVGYVFQTFQLLGAYSALENVLLATAFGAGVDEAAARELLARVGLGDRLHYRPDQLSVGQRQRVAVARALANRPALVLADEPTGNLDPESARDALALIRQICRERDAALLLVSHDEDVLCAFERREALATLAGGKRTVG